MNKLAATKLVVRLIVGSGTTTISNSIIRNNVAPTNLFQQVSVGIASVVIGSMVSEATKSHTDQQIDQIVEAWNKAKSSSNNEDPIPA